MFDFEKLDVYQKAKQFNKEVDVPHLVSSRMLFAMIRNLQT